MSNGIRQGSIISPYLFNVYVDALNILLAESNLGCHIGGQPVNNFSYADDLAIVAPTARALNAMLAICGDLAERNYIEFSVAKLVVLMIAPSTVNITIKPNVYLGSSVLSYIDHYKYLGHILGSDVSVDADIDQERSLAVRRNMIAHRFHFVQKT